LSIYFSIYLFIYLSIYLFIYLPLCTTHFKVLKRRERTVEMNKEKVRQKEMWRRGSRNIGRKGCSSERISTRRMEEKHKNQRKEIKKRGIQFTHKRRTTITFRFLTRKKSFQFSKASLPALESAQYRIQWPTRVLSSGVRRPGMYLESNPDLVLYPPLPHRPSWRSQGHPYSLIHSP
jgi:hypothetical protein